MNMKKLIENGGLLLTYVKIQHMDNFKKLIARMDNFVNTDRAKFVVL